MYININIGYRYLCIIGVILYCDDIMCESTKLDMNSWKNIENKVSKPFYQDISLLLQN